MGPLQARTYVSAIFNFVLLLMNIEDVYLCTVPMRQRLAGIEKSSAMQIGVQFLFTVAIKINLFKLVNSEILV